MSLTPKLELRQGQQLVMTPQLQQAIRLLQLSNIELCTYVEAELERNPLLERTEAPEEQSQRADAQRADDAEDADRRARLEHAGRARARQGYTHEGSEDAAKREPGGPEPIPSGWASLKTTPPHPSHILPTSPAVNPQLLLP
jgi:RNA polymerase sigma-54 factor